MTDTAAVQITDEQLAWFGQRVTALSANVEQAVRGKPDVVALALTWLFAEGHLLLEDVPGVGKTTLARAIAASVDGQWRRIQFTPDLLPSDVTGVTIFNQATPGVRVPPGPGLRQHRASPTRSTGPRRRPSRRCSR